jgi:hypothetical protein
LCFSLAVLMGDALLVGTSVVAATHGIRTNCLDYASYSEYALSA